MNYETPQGPRDLLREDADHLSRNTGMRPDSAESVVGMVGEPVHEVNLGTPEDYEKMQKAVEPEFITDTVNDHSQASTVLMEAMEEASRRRGDSDSGDVVLSYTRAELEELTDGMSAEDVERVTRDYEGALLLGTLGQGTVIGAMATMKDVRPANFGIYGSRDNPGKSDGVVTVAEYVLPANGETVQMAVTRRLGRDGGIEETRIRVAA